MTRSDGVVMTTRLVPLMLVAALLACASSCAKPDWIQQTLVTADVTGTWVGHGGNLELKLSQQGPKVTGSMVWRGLFGTDAGTSGTSSGPVEGSVEGDVFLWHTAGAIHVSDSQMTVSGDEMSGRVFIGAGSFLVTLRRADSSRPASQP